MREREREKGVLKINFVPFQFSLLIYHVKRKTQRLSLDSDRATDCYRVLEFVLSESM